MIDGIEIIEEALLNSMPALQTVLLDGWVLRLSRGYAYRVNCVCPLRYSGGGGTAAKIRLCEELFGANGVPPVFKVTPVLQKGLAGLLLSRGYRDVKTVIAMRCPLETAVAPAGAEIECAPAPDEQWLEASCRLAGVTAPGLAEVRRRCVRSLAVTGVFVRAAADGKTVGCGYGTAERGYAGIYDLHVDEAYRRKGIGTDICKTILRFGREQGTRYGYLIVSSQNRNAIALYSGMGFSPLYEYHFYCKESPYSITDA